MSRFFSEKYSNLIPYTPGEQPQDKKYIKLNTNESPFPPSPLAQKMACEEAGNLQLYSDPEVKLLVKDFAAYFGVGEDEVIFSNGSDDVLNFACMAFCDEKNPLVFPNVTYGFYSVFAELNHVPYEELPVNDDFSINVSDYTGIGKNIFIANPNAQTGIALPLSDIEKIVSSNPGNIVVVDEAYVDFGGESAVCLIKKYDNLIVTGTFSKSRSLAGARIGFAVADKELIRDMNTIRYSTNPYNINRMTMQAARGALADDGYFRENCEKIKSIREYTVCELKKLGFTVTDSKANFILAASDRMGGKELYLALKERGILVRHFETELLRNYNRITIGSKEQMETFIKVTSELLGERS